MIATKQATLVVRCLCLVWWSLLVQHEVRCREHDTTLCLYRMQTVTTNSDNLIYKRQGESYTILTSDYVTYSKYKLGKYWHYCWSFDGPGSSVGIATDYGLDGPGSNPGGDEIFRTCPDRSWGPPSLLHNGYRVFPEVRCGRDVGLNPHPPSSVPRS